MALTLLEMIQAAANELSIPEPSQVVGSTDDTSKQLLALAKREGKEFSQMANKNGGWQALHKEYVFNTQGYSGVTGDVTSGSAVITNISDTSNMIVGMILSGNGILNQSRIISIDSPTQISIDLNANSTNTGVSLEFGFDFYDLPTDLEYFLSKTFWDRSFRWQLLGPLEAQEKNVIKYGISPVGPRRRFWIQKNPLTTDLSIFINPVPTNITDLITFDYMSNAWCLSSLSVSQKTWQADDDTYLLDEDCFILGLKWRFLRAKGLDYAQEYETYIRAANRLMARDGGSRDLPLNAQATSINLLNSTNTPDTGFGSQSSG